MTNQHILSKNTPRTMSAFKHEEVDFWKRYSLHIEIGFLLSFLVLVLAVQVEWSTTKGFKPELKPQERITVTEVTPTDHKQNTPPPPKPPAPIEVPDNRTLETGDVNYDVSLGVAPNAPDAEPPPPEPNEETRDEPFVTVEQPPALVGGKKALYESVEYPPFAKEVGIEGRVIVQFVVDEEGNVQNPTILKGVHKLLNEEAIKAVTEQTFEPGRQRGRPVPVQMEIPVVFQLK